MSAIFLNYRRDDSSGYAGRLFDNLITRFGRERVFMDIETLEPGLDFVDGIERAIRSCGAVIALIGPNWIRATNNQGQRRLDDPSDFIRLEISTAFKQGVRVIPVLVHNASMPTEGELPEPLRKLCRLQSFEISDNRWEFDVGRLGDVLAPLIAEPDVSTASDAARGDRRSSGGPRPPDNGAFAEGETSPGDKPFRLAIAGALLLAVAVLGASWWFTQEQPDEIEPTEQASPATSSTADAAMSPGRQQVSPPLTPSTRVEEPAVDTAPPANTAGQPPEIELQMPAPPPDRAVPSGDMPTLQDPQQPVISIPRSVPPPDSLAMEREAEERERQAREERIAELLDRARADLDELRLTRPPGDNAYERYRQVLELDPENALAHEGFQAIIERYHGLIEDALGRSAFDTAERHLDSARTIDPNIDWLPAVQAEIERRRLRAARSAEPGVPAAQTPWNRDLSLEQCLGACENEHQRCREEAASLVDANCARERSARCDAVYDDCMSDTGNLVIWGPVSQESECAGIHARCERAISEECANPDNTSGCDHLMERCVEECRTGR